MYTATDRKITVYCGDVLKFLPSVAGQFDAIWDRSAIIGRAGASPPSRTAAIIFLYLYIIIIRVVRRALNLLRASFSPLFQYFLLKLYS